MANKKSKKSHKYYKGSSFIVFYDKEDNDLLYMFNNVREILEFKGLPVTTTNVNKINVNIYYALKKQHHFTKILTGELMKLYIIDLTEKDKREADEYVE